MQLTDATGNIIYTDYRLKITIGKGKNSGKFAQKIKKFTQKKQKIHSDKLENPLRKSRKSTQKNQKIHSEKAENPLKKIRKIRKKTHLLPVMK